MRRFGTAVKFFFCLFLGMASARAENCDVVVVGANLAGVFAALESARNGARTCLFAEGEWIGGQISSQGISAIDAPHHHRPVWSELLQNYAAPRATAEAPVVIRRENGLIPLGEYSTPTGDLIVDEAVRCLRPLLDKIPDRAHCWVAHDCFRPSSAQKALEEMAKPYLKTGALRIWRNAVPKRVFLQKGAIRRADIILRSPLASWMGKPLSAEIEARYETRNNPFFQTRTLKVEGRVFIDATETGELIVLSGAEHRLGASGPDCEQTNSEWVMSFVYPLNLAVAPESDPRVQHDLKALDVKLKTYCSDVMESFDTYARENFQIEWNTYRFWSSPDDEIDRAFKLGLPFTGKPSLLGYRRISDQPEINLMNFGQSIPMPARLTDRRGGNDYMGGNFIVPVEQLQAQLQDWKGGIRTEELRKAECHSWAFAKWLRIQPEVKDAAAAEGRTVVPMFSLKNPNNFFGSSTGLSQDPYVRDTRRIVGFGGFCMKLSDYGTDFKKFPDEAGKEALLKNFKASSYYAGSEHSVGIAAYPFDRRKYPNGQYPEIPLPDMKLSEIPLEALVSKNIRNLLAAGKTIATHQIVGSAARTHPFECNAGRGAGAAAAEAALKRHDLHEILRNPYWIRSVQERVIQGGGTTGWFTQRRAAVDEKDDK